MYETQTLPGRTDVNLVRGIQFAMECGDLLVVRYLIERDGPERAQALLGPDLAAWVAAASAHERMHGSGSFLAPDDPFNQGDGAVEWLQTSGELSPAA